MCGLAIMSASKWNRPSATNTMASCSPCSRGAVQPSTSPGDNGRACRGVAAKGFRVLNHTNRGRAVCGLAATMNGCLVAVCRAQAAVRQAAMRYPARTCGTARCG